MFDQLIDQISEIVATREHAVVAISGFGGSGKSTLAEQIHQKLPDSRLLQLDNFLINHGQGEGWDGGYDWDRLEGVLKDIRDGKDLHYEWYNWHTDSPGGWIDQPLPKLIIVEGVKLLQPKLMPYFDLSVWIDCLIEVATARGKARDLAGSKGDPSFDIDEHMRNWDEVWVPKDQEYASLFNPVSLADIIYKHNLL